MIVRILSLAIRNFDRPPRSGFYDAVVAAQDPVAYKSARQQVDDVIADILHTLRMAELDQQVRTIQADSARRQQRYRDEDDFDRTPAKPKSRPHIPLEVDDPPWQRSS